MGFVTDGRRGEVVGEVLHPGSVALILWGSKGTDLDVFRREINGPEWDTRPITMLFELD